MHRFQGKTVIVTGASSGIGKATAERFNQEGANVVINSRSREDLEKVVANMDKARTLIVAGDVSEKGFSKELVKQTVDAFGGLDVLFSNAGIARSSPFEETSDEDIDDTLNINVKGMFYMARDSYAELKKSNGSIICTSSVSGIGGDYEMALYTASKGAVTQLVRSLALEWGKDGIRVNAVNPSYTKTGMTTGMDDNKELIAAFMRRFAIKRGGLPEDVAGAVTFLASEDAGFITGVNLPVDGGINASNGQPDFRLYR